MMKLVRTVLQIGVLWRKTVEKGDGEKTNTIT